MGSTGGEAWEGCAIVANGIGEGCTDATGGEGMEVSVGRCVSLRGCDGMFGGLMEGLLAV